MDKPRQRDAKRRSKLSQHTQQGWDSDGCFTGSPSPCLVQDGLQAGMGQFGLQLRVSDVVSCSKNLQAVGPKKGPEELSVQAGSARSAYLSLHKDVHHKTCCI